MLRDGVTMSRPVAAIAGQLLDGGGSLPHARRDTIDAWCAAVACRDDAEVERLVRQSRVDRMWDAASGQLGMMVG
jgi:hypothetical protein